MEAFIAWSAVMFAVALLAYVLQSQTLMGVFALMAGVCCCFGF